MKMDEKTIRDINSRLYFASGDATGTSGIRPWQYVEMEYAKMGLRSPYFVPRLDTIDDADIWMCLDERVNRSLRMRETALAG